MRRLYNFSANIPFVGLLLELFLLTLWLILIRVKTNNRVPNFTSHFDSTDEKSTVKIIMNCRNFLRPEHSGVNVWIESICKELESAYELTILCQGSNLFSTKTVFQGNVKIKSLPVFKYLRLRKLPLHSSWMDSVNVEIAKIDQESLLITPMNLIMPYGIVCRKNVKQIVLLLTDERRHKYSKLTMQQIKNELKLSKRQKEIVRRERLILQDVNNHFIADSNAIVAELEELYDVSISRRTQISYIDIPSDKCQEVEKKKYVLFVGRSDERKGLNIFLDVYENLMNEFPNWKFIVATSKGDDGQTFRRLQNLTSKNNSIRMFLNVDDQQKHSLLNLSAVALLPSYYESFGITGLEAMQHGCVLISSRVGGIPEVVGDEGILVEPGLAREFSEKLKEVMLDEAQFMTLGESAKIRASNLTDDRNLLPLISNILENFAEG